MMSTLLLSLALLQGAPEAEAQTPPEAAETTAAPASARGGDPIARGLSAYRRMRFAAAETAFRDAVAQQPESAAAHYYLAYAIYKQAEKMRPFHPRKEEAAASFAKAYELDPQFKPTF